MHKFIHTILATGCAFAMLGCGEDTGQINVTTWGEGYIENGIEASEFADGWSVKFERFLVVLGNVTISDEARSSSLTMPGQKLFNHVTPGVKTVTTFNQVAPQSWPNVSFEIPVASAATELDESATSEDLQFMRQGAYSAYVEAELTKENATKSIQWGFTKPTLYNACTTSDGTRGIAVPSGGVETMELTIHGDHVFLDDLGSPEASLRFEALAAADTNNDGAVTLDELTAVQLIDIAPGNGTYGTGVASDINDLGGFVRSLGRTLAHFRGEGSCSLTNP
jgi:hypothetical protein